MILKEQFALFLDQLSGQSPFNLRNYRLRIKDFITEHGSKRAEEITRADVNRWHEAIRERGYAEATIAGYRQSIKSFLNYCLGPNHPASHLKTGSFISKRNKLPPEKYVIACTQVALTWTNSNEPTEVRNAAIFLLSKGSGLRLREIQELRLSDLKNSLDMGPDKNGILSVSSIGKTKDVTIRFGALVAAAIERWLALRPSSRVDRLFITCTRSMTMKDQTQRFRPLSRSAIHKAFIAVSRAAGLDRTIQSHALRHRIGDKLTKEYGPKIAAMYLNHRDWMTSSTAIAFYHHPDTEDVSVAAASIAERAEDLEQLEEMNKLFGID